MSDLRIAYRYAEALMNVAQEGKILTKVANDLTEIRRLINDSHEFKLFLKSPVIKKEKKIETFKAVFGKLVQPLTLQFLTFVSEKEREAVIPNIIEAFFKLQDEKLGILHVKVVSAVELSSEQAERLKKQFEIISKKKVQLETKIDTKLIGGLVARIGDTMFDGSVKRQLQLLQHKFLEEVTVT